MFLIEIPAAVLSSTIMVSKCKTYYSIFVLYVLVFECVLLLLFLIELWTDLYTTNLLTTLKSTLIIKYIISGFGCWKFYIYNFK